ncbi:hypothetical protein PSH55_16425 [Pseudoalteromonas sp. Angola-31]|uniref:hypothetical protein n=1 Tax=Pseudoalteromonas sp. Xi13 TaxID=2490635 RepID=UPI000F750A07|nr:hypothetical protein [Pseudoalteromonas sp. Xi13]AZN34483.1 hypothetical protein EJ103_17380 [Pseudoalteromonas sp. Xi13]MDC9522693.1 hypothetical protein [Pseudoalteromonas sp. Angola-31]
MKTFSDTTRKNVISVLVGPLAIIPAILIMGLVSHLLFPEESAITDWKQVFNFYSVIGIMIAYVLTTLFALPLVVVLQKMKAFTLLNVVLLALGIAGVLCLASSSQLLAFLYFGYFTVSVAISCWGIHRWV